MNHLFICQLAGESYRSGVARRMEKSASANKLRAIRAALKEHTGLAGWGKTPWDPRPFYAQMEAAAANKLDNIVRLLKNKSDVAPSMWKASPQDKAIHRVAKTMMYTLDRPSFNLPISGDQNAEKIMKYMKILKQQVQDKKQFGLESIPYSTKGLIWSIADRKLPPLK